MKQNQTRRSESKPHSITIHLSDRAYALLLGQAGFDNYGLNQLEKMVLQSVASSVEATYEGGSEFEQEVYKIFGVK